MSQSRTHEPGAAWPPSHPRTTREEGAEGNGVQPDVPADEERVYISPGAYLRSMLAIAWSAFRHPFSTTTIDLTTGEVLSNE